MCLDNVANTMRNWRGIRGNTQRIGQTNCAPLSLRKLRDNFRAPNHQRSFITIYTLFALPARRTQKKTHIIRPSIISSCAYDACASLTSIHMYTYIVQHTHVGEHETRRNDAGRIHSVSDDDHHGMQLASCVCTSRVSLSCVCVCVCVCAPHTHDTTAHRRAHINHTGGMMCGWPFVAVGDVMSRT